MIDSSLALRLMIRSSSSVGRLGLSEQSERTTAREKFLPATANHPGQRLAPSLPLQPRHAYARGYLQTNDPAATGSPAGAPIQAGPETCTPATGGNSRCVKSAS